MQESEEYTTYLDTLEAMDRFESEDHDCHLSPDDGCIVCSNHHESADDLGRAEKAYMADGDPYCECGGELVPNGHEGVHILFICIKCGKEQL